jgi:ssDNA-binding Zn-finger/Zn-ribbon topoisomerase 1
MAQYTFKCPKCEEIKVVTRPMSDDSKVACDKCKTVMHRDYQTAFGKQRRCDTYPFASYAMGVSPSEVPDMVAIDKQLGVPTEYNGDGDPVMRDAKHRKAYVEAHGCHDRNAGWSDPVPANCR